MPLSWNQQEALEMARTIASRNLDAARAGKKLLNDAMLGSTYDGLLAESNCSRTLICTGNQIEAIMSGMDVREPLFFNPE
jgi:enoyl-CoA hydratase/carnithine racemase